MENPYVIGMDFGSDSVRAVLADALTGKELGSEVSYYKRWSKGLYSDARKAQFRHHPKDYLEALTNVITTLTTKFPNETKKVVALALDSTASTPCFCDKEGQPLALQEKFKDNPNAMFVLWKDHTGQKESEEINAVLEKEPINYAREMGNNYSPECFWAKVLHILRNDSEVAKEAYSVIELCDFIPATLTGNRDAKHVKVGRCIIGCKWMYSPDWGGLPPEDFFNKIDPILIPILKNLPQEPYSCDKSVGTLTQEWADKLGLPAGIKVGAGNVDSHSGAVGGGCCYGTVVMNLGTSACYMTVMPKKEMEGKFVDGIFGQVEDGILPGMYGFEAGLSAMGDSYAWLKRLLSWPLYNIVKKTSLIEDATKAKLIEETEGQIIVELTKEAEKLDITLDSPTATDWFNGRRTPFPNTKLTATIGQLTLASSAPEIFYAIAEATAFATRNVIEHYKKNGIYIDRLIGIGGIAPKSPFIMQLLSDAMDMQIDISDCKQAGAFGSVIHAATVAGIYKSVTDAQKALCLPANKSYKPNHERHAFLMKRFEKYAAVAKFSEEQTQ